ncbi:thiol reductant ABC exporter subunit CydC [Methylohalomonas lacus]|nr:thiol reductant ABC exporter subunit CydC [Methylohalomonas lacus]
MLELRPYLRLLLRRRGRLLLGIGLMLVTVLAAVGLLAVSGWLITATAVTAALWAAGNRVAFDVYVPGGAIRAFALTRTVARYFERVYNHDTVLRLLADLRSGVFAALTRLDVLAQPRLRDGLLLNRLTADIDALDNLYLRLLAPPLVALLASLAVALLLGWFLPASLLLTLPTLLILLLLTSLVCARHGYADSTRQMALGESLRLRLLEQFQGLAELIAYGALDRHRRWLVEEETDLLAGQRRLGRRLAGYNALVTLVIQTLSVAVLALALQAFQIGELSAALAVFMALAVLGLGEAFAALPAGFIHFGATCAAARRLTEQANRSEPQAVPTTTRLPRTAQLHAESLYFRYPAAETPVLDRVTLTLEPGQRLAISGRSGSGKSTFADLLAGLRRPDSGELLFGGCRVDQLPPDARRARIAYLTQRSDLFAASIADNLRIASSAADRDELWQALHCVDLADWATRLPDGLDTWIGEAGHRISGGQGRRLALARLLLRDPWLVILDEPFAGLDRATINTIGERLDGWLQQRSCIVFCHDTRGVPGLDRVMQLAAGRLHENRP